MSTTPEQTTCGAARDTLPCVLDDEHGGMYHEDANGYRWPTAAAMHQAADDLRPAGLAALLDHVAANLPDSAPEPRLALVDGRDALAAVIIRPHPEDPDAITVEANARGMSKAVAAYALRQTADEFDAAALAEGDEPITAEEATKEQQQRPDRVTPEQAAAEFDAGTALLAGEQVIAYAAAIQAATLREAAERIATLGKARGWSTWAADYLHPDREFVDTGEATEEEPATPAEGDQYVKREDPDEGRVITVERVWTADDGHTAVAYKWDSPRSSYAGSACPLDVFHRTYEPVAHR
ncbi:hypothetical protein ACIQUU_31995 [Streptomyces sp. NPDC101116]|uniref:hypothetical protein n=1 Tax=Streptomyces sp. NPDC101116 TaxID=3366107 RepID=UPI003801C647